MSMFVFLLFHYPSFCAEVISKLGQMKGPSDLLGLITLSNISEPPQKPFNPERHAGHGWVAPNKKSGGLIKRIRKFKVAVVPLTSRNKGERKRQTKMTKS